MGIRVLSLAVVALIALSGCGPTTSSPTPTATPSSTAGEPVAAPRSVVDLPCEESIDAAVVAAVAGRDVTDVFDLDRGPIERTDQVLEIQIGMQRCSWWVEDVSNVGFAIIPDATEAYAARSGWFEVVNEQYIRRDALGDRSVHACSYGYCVADILVGEHWVTVHAWRPDLVDELDTEPLFLPFARHVVDVVRAAAGSEREPWVMAADAFRPTPGWCEEPVVSQLGAVLGVPTLYTPGSDGYTGANFEIWDRSGFQMCSLAGDNGERPGSGRLEVIPGALWALPELTAEPSVRYGEYQRVESDALESDVFVAANANGASAFVGLGGGVLWFAYDGLDREGILELLPGVVEVVRANPAPPG